jgi:CheY-like chemotaxis protein
MPKLILLIDDDKEELDIMNQALEIGHIEGLCLWANGVERATHLLREVLPDFIFIDLNMPRMDGLTCLQELKKNNQLIDIPIVMYSTHISEITRRKAVEKGAACCIQKPDTIETLVKQLTSFFEESNHPIEHK